MYHFIKERVVGGQDSEKCSCRLQESNVGKFSAVILVCTLLAVLYSFIMCPVIMQDIFHILINLADLILCYYFTT